MSDKKNDKGRISDAELEKVAGGASSSTSYRSSSSGSYRTSSSSSSSKTGYVT